MTRLYLDFDGVLHRFEPGTSPSITAGGGKFAFEHAPALAAMLELFPEVEVYAHSAWRHQFWHPRPDDIVQQLGPLGDRFARFVPSTIRGSRYDAIREDMLRDGYHGHWVAVDDEDGGFSAAGAQSHFVQTETSVGLDDRALDELAKKLLGHAMPSARGLMVAPDIEAEIASRHLTRARTIVGAHKPRAK